jgi:hypothetical protein
MMYYCNNPDMPDNEKPPWVKQGTFSKIRGSLLGFQKSDWTPEEDEMLRQRRLDRVPYLTIAAEMKAHFGTKRDTASLEKRQNYHIKKQDQVE